MKLYTYTVSPELLNLLQKLMEEEALRSFFAAKYANDSLWNVEKSLTYFDDAENDPDPRDLRGRRWEEIQQTIRASSKL